jgi:hypothetical protein
MRTLERKFFDGGELQDGEVFFTKHNGEIVGRSYVRERVRREFSQWNRTRSRELRKEVLARTVDSDSWLAFRNHCLVAAVVRDAVDELLAAY